jgi:hypothetical protein
MMGRSSSWSAFRRLCISFLRGQLLVYLVKHFVSFFFVQSVMLRCLLYFVFIFIMQVFGIFFWNEYQSIPNVFVRDSIIMRNLLISPKSSLYNH